MERAGVRVPTSCVEVVSGPFRVDDLAATLTYIRVNGEFLFGSGYIHGQIVTPLLPQYLREVAVLHALRALREWMQTVRDRGLIQHVNIRAGSALVCHQIARWFRGHGCALASSAASGLVQELGELPHWLGVDTSLSPFYLPESFDAPVVPSDIRMFVGLAEHFRVTVLPQQPARWRKELPRVPLTTAELKQLVVDAWEADERRALRQLSELGSVSASVLTYLELTRAVVAEAYEVLRDEREAQTNLVEILSATRYKTYRGSRVYHTKCARLYCYSVDSFPHMLDCYSLLDSVDKGPTSVPFLVQMARRTCRPRGSVPIPYLEQVTDHTRGQAAADVRERLGGDGEDALNEGDDGSEGGRGEDEA